MLPISPILYSTTTGSSLDMQILTVGDRGVALVKELRYRSAKVSMTGSFSSMEVFRSALSADEFCLQHTDVEILAQCCSTQGV